MKHVVDLQPSAVELSRPPKVGPIRRVFRWIIGHLGFLIFVVLPTALAITYYGFIASPVYMSQSQFIVKDSNSSSALSGLGSFLTSAGLATSSNDAYAISGYITSREALRQLESYLNVREIYNRPGADFIARFPNFYTFYRTSFEWLYWYHYWWWIESDFNTTTNVTTLYTWAFTPEDARALNLQLLTLAENTVNGMNDKAHLDALRAAKDEVALLQQRANDIETQITNFRNNELILNPNQVESSAETLRMTLEGSLVSSKALLVQLQQTAPASPQIPGLKLRIKSLEAEVSDQEHKDSGGVGTLAPKIQAYDALLLQQQFITQMLQAAVTGLETAEVAAIQQTLYIQRLEEPGVPDYPMYPYRVINSLLVFLTTLFMFGIVKVIFATVREHIA